jgi:hypothetical protein
MSEALTKIEVEIANKRGPATDDVLHFIKLFHPEPSRKDITQRPRNYFINRFLCDGGYIRPSILVVGYAGEVVRGYATLREADDIPRPHENKSEAEFSGKPYMEISSLLLTPWQPAEDLVQLAVATVALASRVGFHRVQVPNTDLPSADYWHDAGFRHQLPNNANLAARACLSASLNGHLNATLDVEPDAIHRLISFRASLTLAHARAG